MSWFPANLIRLITAAMRDASKLPAALVCCGVFLIASALALIISKNPASVLVTWHGTTAACTYYAVLVSTAALGVAEALFGLWVDLERWKLTAKVLLSVSLLALAVLCWLLGRDSGFKVAVYVCSVLLQ